MKKRIIALFLLTLAVLPLFVSCKGDDYVEPDEYVEYTVTEGVDIWSSNGYDKILQTVRAPKDSVGKSERELYLAKNETEGFQISLRTEAELSDLTFEISKIRSAGKKRKLDIKLYTEYYVEANGKDYPDAIVPFDEKIALPVNTTKTFLVEVETSADTEAGEYSFDVVLKSRSSGTVYGVVTAKVTVWNYTLPVTSSCTTTVGLSRESMAVMENVSGAEAIDEMHLKYYEMLLDYKLTPTELPYDILDDRADAYMSDPRVTSFMIPYSYTDSKITEYYNKLSQNPEWMEKGYFYPVDEPNSKGALVKIDVAAKRLEKLFPGFQLGTAFFTDIYYDENTDAIEFMEDSINIWCPKAPAFDGNWIYKYGQEEQYGPFSERMYKQKAEGDKLWWYVCWEPGNPYCNLLINQKGIQHRMLFWQQKQCDVDGFLYWAANYWTYTNDPWVDMLTSKFITDDTYGDGSLLYNGSKVGLDGPCASLRLTAVRDGIDDFDMLTLAEAEFGAEWVKDMIKDVSWELTGYTSNSKLFDKTRMEIGNALSERYAEKNSSEGN